MDKSGEYGRYKRPRLRTRALLDAGQAAEVLEVFVFIGEYLHTMDQKGRCAIPAKFRVVLAAGCVVTRGLDNSLVLYSVTEWAKMAKKLSKLPFSSRDARAFSRLMLAGAMDLELDKQGRILIPSYLRDYAGLSSEVIITGAYNRLEIWAKDKWEEYRSESEDKAVSIADELQDKDINL